MSPGQRQLIRAAPDAIAVVDRGGRIVELNTQLGQLFGYSEVELRNRAVEQLIPDRLQPVHEDHRRRYDGAPRVCTMGGGHELFGKRRDGAEFPIEVRLSPLVTPDDTLYIAIVRDVSERKMASDRLKTSLMAQEALLKEIQHRVKNNMQVISSLLRLQSDSISDATARAAFAESLSRVQAIALTHEILRHSNAVPEVNLAEYGAQLIAEVARIYGATPDWVRVDVSIAPVYVSFDTAVDVGLVLNELVSNCLKHAFVGRERGRVRVGMRSPADGGIELTVSDDGIGMPSTVDPSHPQSLGLQIVNNLVYQLGATLSHSGERGTTFTIRIPASA